MMPTCNICRLGTICVHAWERERDTLRSDLARVTAERDAAVEVARIKAADGADAMALVISLEGTVHRVTEELRVARLDASTTSLQADGYRRERDAAVAEFRLVNGERTLLLCLCNEMSPDDAPDVVTAAMAYDAVDKMQDRLFAAEDGRDAVIRERDALRAEVEAMRGVVEVCESALNHARPSVKALLSQADELDSDDIFEDDREALKLIDAALDALRTRKVGG